MSKLEQVNTRLQRMMRRVREEALEEGERRGLERGLREGFEEGERRGLERGLREGEERGLKRGLREGERRALRSALVAVLEARFGSVPQWARERIDAASAEELDCWVRRAATAESVEAVFESE